MTSHTTHQLPVNIYTNSGFVLAEDILICVDFTYDKEFDELYPSALYLDNNCCIEFLPNEPLYAQFYSQVEKYLDKNSLDIYNEIKELSSNDRKRG